MVGKEDKGTLSRSRLRERTLDELDEALATMRKWHRAPHDETKDDEIFRADYQEYLKAMNRAIRAGLTDDPRVQEFIHTRRCLGSRDTLRRARSGVEKGVKQYTPEDMILRGKIASFVEDYAGRHGGPPKQAEALKHLINGRIVKRMSRQAFNKLVKKLMLRCYFHSW